MQELKKYEYELETISDLVLSPRTQNCFYRGQHFDSADNLHLSDNVKMIYPFYQYGTYERYRPNEAQYYIPGSSIKGAIGEHALMADDIKIERRVDICPKTLYKIQHLSDEPNQADSTHPRLEEFFPGVAVEMLSAGSRLVGTMFSQTDPCESLETAQAATKQKLDQLVEAIGSIIGEGEPQIKSGSFLTNLRDNIQALQTKAGQDDRFLLLLGGYKGLLLSSIVKEKGRIGGIYVDEKRALPHGLVWVKLI